MPWHGREPVEREKRIERIRINGSASVAEPVFFRNLQLATRTFFKILSC